jgi:hypothetical protein
MLAPEPAVLAALLAGLLSPLVVDIAVCLLAIGRVSRVG